MTIRKVTQTEDPGLKAKLNNFTKINTIILANNREFFSPIDKYVLEEQLDEFVEADFDEADMDVMILGDNKAVVVSRPIDPDFIADITKLFGYKNLQIITPKDSGKGLSFSLENDKKALRQLQEMIKHSDKVSFVPWGVTRETLSLIKTLKKKVKLYTPECPIESGEWIPDYANTKIGSREVLLKVSYSCPSLNLMGGFTAPDLLTGSDIAKYLINKGKGVVFKANLGVGGIGVNVFPLTKELKSEVGFNNMIKKIARNSLFNSAPFIVEEYIEPDFKSSCTFPSIEALINTDGSVDIKAYTAMVIESKNEELTWHGIGIGKGVFTPKQIKPLKEVTTKIGECLYEMGYRGWIDVDFIYSTSKKFYCTEVNVRMTPARYMIELSKLLFGNEYAKKMCIVSDDKFIRQNLKGLSYKKIKKRLSSLLYPINGEKRGIIITESYRSKFGRGKFGYVSIGNDFKDASNIVSDFKNLFN